MVAHRMIVAFARDGRAGRSEGKGVVPLKHSSHSLDGRLLFMARLIGATLPDLGFLLMCVALLIRSRAPMPRIF